MKDNIPSCKYRRMVDCPEQYRNCDKCGFNPEVECRRILDIRKAYTRKRKTNFHTPFNMENRRAK